MPSAADPSSSSSSPQDPPPPPNRQLPSIRLYALGSNGSGQLSLPHLEDRSFAELCWIHGGQSLSSGGKSTSTSTSTASASPSTTNWKFKKLVAGGNHTAILFENGVVIIAGHGIGEEFWKEKEKVKRNAKDHEWGRTTAAAAAEPLFRPVKVERSPSRRDGKDGGVSDDDDDDDEFLLCSDIAATWSATIFITIDGKSVYALGKGEKGELGLGEEVSETLELAMGPVEVVVGGIAHGNGNGGKAGTKIASVAAGMSHVILVLEDGRCFGWGSCRKGEIGENRWVDEEDVQSSTTTKKMMPQRKSQWTSKRVEINTNAKVKKAICGKEWTLLQLEDGSHLKLGLDRWLSTRHVLDIQYRLKDARGIYGSWGSLYALMDDGSVQAIGRNDRGQLPPDKLPAIAKFAAGSEHAVALTKDGEVISWGWGEHGNCGGKEDVVASGWNAISVDLEEGWHVVNVGAGCATTFIIAAPM